MGYLPIFLDVTGKPCVVVGGGEIAERKVHSLLDHGARVTVISPSVRPRLKALVDSSAVTWHRRRWRSGDLRGFALVYCAIDDSAASRMIASEARELGIQVNVADRPELCTFVAPAVVRRGDLQIAISTSGASPALAADIRAGLERQFGAEYALTLMVLRAARALLRARDSDSRARGRRMAALVACDVPAIIRAGDRRALERALLDNLGVDLAALGLRPSDLFPAGDAQTSPRPE
jgi:precorrin-2 dehydrogenase/sirohydrochlorin ferrochelatase